MVIKTLFDNYKKQYFYLKNNNIVYTAIPKIYEKGEIINFKSLSSELKEYIEKNCVTKFVKMSIQKQKPIVCGRRNVKQFKLSDYYLIRENREMGISAIRNMYFPEKSVDSIKAFYSRMSKKEKEGWL